MRPGCSHASCSEMGARGDIDPDQCRVASDRPRLQKTDWLERVMPQSHGVVWMDFKEAHVFRFGVGDVETRRIKAHNPFRKVHHKAGAIGAGKGAADLSFFDHIADALRGVTEWLLVGPGHA